MISPMIPSIRRSSVPLLAAVLSLAADVHAQCATQWSEWPQCPGSAPLVLAALPNGDIVAGGTFTTFGGVAAAYVARWDGANWTPMGSGMDDIVAALAVLPNGDVVAGGYFEHAGGLRSNHVARWDGSAWAPMSVGMNGEVLALHVLPNGDLIAGGHFSQAGGFLAANVARWDGSSWSPLGGGINTYGWVRAITARSTGEVIVAGSFTNSGSVTMNHIASWNGATWAPLGTGLGVFPAGTLAQANALASLANGDIVVGGTFTTAGGATARRIARWSGSTWAPLGLGVEQGFPLAASVSALTTLAGGDLAVAGTFTSAGGVPAMSIARWNAGTGTWSALGTGWQFTVSALTVLPNGDLVGSGNYAATTSCELARLTTTCPATATVGGFGCPGSGGDNTLAAATLPWVDTTFRATGSGLPTIALVVALTSVTAIPQGSAPLSSLFAEGVAGCDVLVAPDIVQLLSTSTGMAQSTLFLPGTPPLVGVSFHHQMVPIEIDALGGWVAITATNALLLTAGSF